MDSWCYCTYIKIYMIKQGNGKRSKRIKEFSERTRDRI